MQWEKLERSFLALDKLLRSLRATDSFNVLLFNSEVARFSPANVTAAPDAVDKALAFVRASRLRGGTNLEAALKQAADAAATAQGGESYIVLLSDGDATRGANIQNVKIAGPHITAASSKSRTAHAPTSSRSVMTRTCRY